MKAGDIVLVTLQQSDGAIKRRPALLIKQLPPFRDWLLCGISTQVHQEVRDFDVLLEEHSTYFAKTGLKQTSLVRLGFLAVIQSHQILGSIGEIPEEILSRVKENLSDFIRS